MRIRRRTLVAASSLLITAGSVVAAAPPSQASSCSNGHACYYYLTNRGGSSFGDSCGIDNFASYSFNVSGYPLNNNVESVRGASYAFVILWADAHRSGTAYGVSNGTTVNDLGSFSNRASSSSFKFPEGGGCPTV